MTDLPVAILSVTSVLLCIQLLRAWTTVNLCLLAIALGLTLSVKHSGLISFGFVATFGLGALLWQSRRDRSLALRRSVVFIAVLGCGVAILWGNYAFRYFESRTKEEKFNRTLASKIEDVRNPIWRSSLRHLATWHVLPRSYIWGLADIVRTGMEGRAYSTYAFGKLTFMKRRPLVFPGYVAVRVPLALTLLSSFGCLLAFHRGTPRLDRIAAAVLLALASVLLIVLMLSNADYAGVRHALTVYFVMAVLCGFAMRFLLRSQRKAIGVAVFALVLGACTPALIVERPWEYHNFLAGGTGRAYRYFRNDGIDLGQRDKEIAEYCRQKLEPAGEVPYVGYYPSLIKPDLVSYRHVRLKALDNPSGGEIPPATISGTLLVHASGAAPAIWSDHKALREAQPVGRMGNVLVYRGTFYLPNIRADALFDRAAMLLEQPNPDFPRIESLLKEGLVLRSNDFSGWMMLGNLHLIRREREEARSLRQGPRQYSAQPISYALRRTDREGLEPTCGLG